MSFNPLRAFRQQRIVRAGVGILVLAAAAFLLYKLAHVPRPVDLATEGKFSPTTIKLGEQELIIEGPVVNPAEGLLFSYDSGTSGYVQVGFDRARLDQQSVETFESLGIKLPATWAPIDFRAAPPKSSSDHEPCSTRIELRVASQAPAAIRISQFGELDPNRRRHIQITATGAELISHLLTQSEGDLYLAPGCQKELTIEEVNHSTSLDVTAHAAENSAIHLRFFPLKADSTSWADAQGFLPLDLGGAPKLSATDAPPFQARAVSVRSLSGGTPTYAPVVLSARSEDNGPLLTVSSLRIFSDQLQISVLGKGSVEIDGVAQTANFLELVKDNQILALVLGAANAALLAWVARLVFKAPHRSRSTKYD